MPYITVCLSVKRFIVIIETFHTLLGFNIIKIALEFLKQYEIIVIAAVGDNARNMTSALNLVFDDQPTVSPIRCAAHSINFIVKETLNSIEFLQSSCQIPKKYIEEGKVHRYCKT